MRRTLTLVQEVAVADILRARAKVVDGSVEFEDGWSDAKIAELAGVAADQVASVRRRLMGNVNRKRDDDPAAGSARVAAIEAEVAAIKAEIATLRASAQRSVATAPLQFGDTWAGRPEEQT